MKVLRALNSLWLAFNSSINRFPITLILAAAVTVLTIIISSIDQSTDEATSNLLIRIAMVLALGIPLSLCIKLLFERRDNLSNNAKFIVCVAGALLLILYYFFLLPNFNLTPISRYVAFSLALYLTFIFLPYFYKREHFERYVITLSTRFLVTAVYSAVLFAGIAIILFTIDKLLNISVSGKAYFNVWVTIVGIFAPSFFLAGVPSDRGNTQVLPHDYPNLLKILLLNIVMPLIMAYSAILYIYFAKIILTSVWPNGLVGHLVLWYSIVSIGVIFYIAPLRSQNKWAGAFTFWFPKMILPILVMMFISIGIRINAYGVTENRYYVVAAGIWVLGIMFYLNLTRIKRNIIVLVSFACIAVLAVVGPWSAFSISEWSQNQRFHNILVKYEMIENGAVVKPKLAVSKEDQLEINQIIYYFIKSHDLQDLNYVPDNFKTADMESVFGFAYAPYDYYNPGVNPFYLYTNPADQPIDIKGYDYLLHLQGSAQEMKLPNDDLEIKYNIQSSHDRESQLQIAHKGKTIYANSLAPFVEQLVAKYPDNGKALITDDTTYTDENEAVSLKVIIFNVNGTRAVDEDQLNIEGMDFYVLIKLK